MPRLLSLLIVLLAVVGALWLFFWSDAVDPATSDLAGLEVGTEDSDGPGTDPLEAPPSDSPDPASPEAPDEPVEAADPAKADPTLGALELRVTDHDGDLLDGEGVTAHIKYPKRPDRPAVPGVLEGVAALFRFRDLPLGAVQIYVDGDLVRPGMVPAVIVGGETRRRTLIVHRAAAIGYDIQHADGSRPEAVHLRLLDGEGRPVSARYRSLVPDEQRPRQQRGRLVRMPARGVVFGLRPGTYTLEATALEGGAAEETTSVGAGATTRMILLLER